MHKGLQPNLIYLTFKDCWWIELLVFESSNKSISSLKSKYQLLPRRLTLSINFNFFASCWASSHFNVCSCRKVSPWNHHVMSMSSITDICVISLFSKRYLISFWHSLLQTPDLKINHSHIYLLVDWPSFSKSKWCIQHFITQSLFFFMFEHEITVSGFCLFWPFQHSSCLVP